MSIDVAILSEVSLFAQLDAQEQALLAARLTEVRVAAGQRFFHRGDPGGSLFIVSEGEVELSIDDTTGRRVVFAAVQRGEFFGELSLLDGLPRSADATALRETCAVRVDRKDLEALFQGHPSSAMDVLAAIGSRLREADQLLRVRPSLSPNQTVEERLTPLQRLADGLADFSGRFSFLLLHAAFFAVWIGLNLGLLPGTEVFDPYPFGLLTMGVSLEAIFLSCFVLISQSRQAAKDRIRSDAEYEANIRAGMEVTQLHQKVDHLYEQMMGRLAALESGGDQRSTG